MNTDNLKKEKKEKKEKKMREKRGDERRTSFASLIKTLNVNI